MRKLFLFLSGLMLVVATCGILFLSAAIYETGKKVTVAPYFFQPDEEYTRRPGVPASPDDLGANAENVENTMIYRRLISRVITQMFYVTPDTTIKSRAAELRHVMMPDVLDTWHKLIAPEIEKQATDKMLRTVHVINIIPEGEYRKVEYELKTWTQPNNLDLIPEISFGTVYLKLFYKPGMRQEMVQTGQTVTEYLEDGGNPAAVFSFGILDMAVPQ